MKSTFSLLCFLLTVCILPAVADNLTRYVNPFLGTATLWDKQDLHYERHKRSRTWGAETFPGAALPCGMVQVSPVTMFHSGSGYQYEDNKIYGFAHTNKGHWNLLHVPLLPTSARQINADDYASPFSHADEEARPGYYRVKLERDNIMAELTSTLRCAFHRYTFSPTAPKRLIVDITRNNNRVTDWHLRQAGARAFEGWQDGEGKIYFYAVSDVDITSVNTVKGKKHSVMVVNFADIPDSSVLRLRIGFSFVSVGNAKMNLEAEIGAQNFDEIAQTADSCWESLLSKIRVHGGTLRHKRIFYSCLYRSMMWPALRSDVNGDYTDVQGRICNGGFGYYTLPSFWDDYRNKLILLGLLLPHVTQDVLKTIIDMGEKTNGYMPTFFHGDHASTFVAGSWLRGLRDFDLQRAYALLLRNATVPGNEGRPYLDEYLKQGWIAEEAVDDVPYFDEYKAAVTKTVEYAYDDYATALVARELGDTANYNLLMQRSQNYRNVFDPSTGFYRGRTANGRFVRQFDPYYPYFAYQFREANAWQSLFYAPHDPHGVVSLYPSKKAVEQKLDSLFNQPWRGYEVENLTGFIGNYCHGNQPGHSQPYMYYFVNRQPKAQCILDSIMNHYYDMGREHLALAGMDDAGEMSSWFVFNAIGLYTYSPADPEYIISVPLFPRIEFQVAPHRTFTIIRQGRGSKIISIRCDGQRLHGWFLSDILFKQGKTLLIQTAR